MKICLIDYSNNQLENHSLELAVWLAKEGMSLVDTFYASDLALFVLDEFTPSFEMVIGSVSRTDRPLWVYIPRGQIVPPTVSESVNRHLSAFGNKAVQRIFTYDATTDILSWVLRLRKDRQIERRRILLAINARIRKMLQIRQGRLSLGAKK